jgi:hypothetical protein
MCDRNVDYSTNAMPNVIFISMGVVVEGMAGLQQPYIDPRSDRTFNHKPLARYGQKWDKKSYMGQ